jgi:hypothetical protein
MTYKCDQGFVRPPNIDLSRFFTDPPNWPLPSIKVRSRFNNTTESFSECKEKFCSASSGSSEEEEAFYKLLNSCSIPSEAREVYNMTSREYFENRAFDRWLDLCTTTEEAREAYSCTSNYEREEKAFDRWLSLCRSEEDARAAYRGTSLSHREEKAKEKIRSFGGEI